MYSIGLLKTTFRGVGGTALSESPDAVTDIYSCKLPDRTLRNGQGNNKLGKLTGLGCCRQGTTQPFGDNVIT